jgi:hypothetical protein
MGRLSELEIAIVPAISCEMKIFVFLNSPDELKSSLTLNDGSCQIPENRRLSELEITPVSGV